MCLLFGFNNVIFGQANRTFAQRQWQTIVTNNMQEIFFKSLFRSAFSLMLSLPQKNKSLELTQPSRVM